MADTNSSKMVYIGSDLHLGHRNIIKYCDRPFDSVCEMDDTVVENWNATVAPDDRVLFLGDLAPFEDREHVVQAWLNKLNGEVTFIYGNHDEVVPNESHHHLTYHLDNYDLYLTHYPSDVPDNRNGWTIYGHHHNNNPDKYPFVDPDRKRVNVSIELLEYKPLPVTKLFELVKAGKRLTIRPCADKATALQE